MKNHFHNAEWLGRIAMAIVFFWFGILKILDVSPAAGLVHDLLQMTLPFIPYSFFIIFLGVWEALIGVLFLFPRITKFTLWLMGVQMFTTFGPLLFLPRATWSTFLLVPTLEGQYIIKNLVIIAMGYAIFVLHKARKTV